MEFEDWLVSQGLSHSTVKKYVSAIDGPLSKWARENDIYSNPLRNILDPEEFALYSELIESTDIFSERNTRGNSMYSAALNNYARFLEQIAVPSPTGPFGSELAEIEDEEDSADPFEPKGQQDARERILRSIVQRQGQPKFRKLLLVAYESRCAITQCDVKVVLEAAHITPYLGPETNAVSNGLLLRADIHTLWDAGLIAINPTSMKVYVSGEILDPAYQTLHGVTVFQPIDLKSRASIAALNDQWDLFKC